MPCEHDVPAAGIPGDSYLRMRLVDADGQVASQCVTDVAAGTRGMWRVELPFVLENPVLWDGLKNPYLYQAQFSLVSGDKVLDSVVFDTGFRYYEITDKGFLLNGKPYPVHGVVMHRDRVMVGSAVTPMQIEEDFNIVREMGANAVRVAGGRHADLFLRFVRRGRGYSMDRPAFHGSYILYGQGIHKLAEFQG